MNQTKTVLLLVKQIRLLAYEVIYPHEPGDCFIWWETAARVFEAVWTAVSFFLLLFIRVLPI